MSNSPVVLITGATGGIGRAVVEQLAPRNAALVLAGRRSAALNELASAARARGAAAVAVPTDVTRRADVADLVSEAVASFGRIDVLINCAGVGLLKPVEQLTDDDIDRCYAVNTKGVIVVTQAVGAEMIKQRSGRVITPVGTMGRWVMRGSAAYSASKWGAVGALKAMAVEWQRSGIGISLVYLGGVDTPFWDAIDMRVQRDKMLSAGDAARAIVACIDAPSAGVMNEIVLQPDSHQFM